MGSNCVAPHVVWRRKCSLLLLQPGALRALSLRAPGLQESWVYACNARSSHSSINAQLAQYPQGVEEWGYLASTGRAGLVPVRTGKRSSTTAP